MQFMYKSCKKCLRNWYIFDIMFHVWMQYAAMIMHHFIKSKDYVIFCIINFSPLVTNQVSFDSKKSNNNKLVNNFQNYRFFYQSKNSFDNISTPIFWQKLENNSIISWISLCCDCELEFSKIRQNDRLFWKIVDNSCFLLLWKWICSKDSE